MGREIETSFNLASTGLAWTRALAELRPDLRSRLPAVMSGADGLRWAIGWLDIASGCYILEISRYFEDQAYALRSDWSEIGKGLA